MWRRRLLQVFPGERGLMCHAQDSPEEGRFGHHLGVQAEHRAEPPRLVFSSRLGSSALGPHSELSPSEPHHTPSSLPLILPETLGRMQGKCWGPKSEMRTLRPRETASLLQFGKTGIRSWVFCPPTLGFLFCSLLPTTLLLCPPLPPSCSSTLVRDKLSGLAIVLCTCSLKPSTIAGSGGPPSWQKA